MKHNIMKRTLAGVMANVGTGGIFDSTAIVASASQTCSGINISFEGFSTTLEVNSLPYHLTDDDKDALREGWNRDVVSDEDEYEKWFENFDNDDIVIDSDTTEIGYTFNYYGTQYHGCFNVEIEGLVRVNASCETMDTNTRAMVYQGSHFKVNVEDKGDDDGFFLMDGSRPKKAYINALSDEVIAKIELIIGYYSAEAVNCSAGTKKVKDSTTTFTNVNQSSVTISASGDYAQIKQVKVYYIHKVAAKEATCKEGGNIEYYYTDDGKYYVFENGEYKEITKDSWVIPASGHHQYGSPTWTWGKDFASQEEQGDVYASGTVNVSQLKVGDILLPGTKIYGDKLNEVNGWNWFIYSEDHPFIPDVGGGLTGLGLGASYVAPNALLVQSISAHEIRVEENTRVLDKDVTADFTCGKCGGVEKAKAVVTSQVASEPTYTAAGKIVYTATATFEGSEYTATKEVAIPQLTLTHHDAVAPSCTEDGTVEYWHDENLDKYFADASGTTELTSIVAPATGHQYGSPEWTNNTDGSVTATFTCDKCGETKTGTVTATQMQTLMSMSGMVTKTWNWADDYSTASLTLSNIPAQALALINDADLRNEITANGITIQAVVTSKDVAATCTTPGQKIYTAAVYTLTDTKKVDVSNALGHTYGAPEWHWNEDFTQATATFTCEKGDSTESEEAVVTSDKQDGKTIYTATVTFNGQKYTDVKYTDVKEVSTAPVILITAQPEDVSIVAKKNVSFSVEAVEGCTYQWFYRRSAAAAWARVANNGTSATYTTSGNADRDGWQFYCVVKKGDATEESQVATLHYETLITAQPEDITIHSKKNVTFEVGSAEDCTYQWFYRKSATSNWIRVSNGGTDASYTTTGQATRDGWQFCCKVMKNGESVLSDVATLNYESLITAQPEDVTISGKQDVTFTVESIEDCTYQWFYRKSATSNWIRVSNGGTAASYTTAGQNTRDGWQFCCKVMKNGESVLSDVATLNYQSLITAQPEDVTISTKQNVTFTVASEEGCTYEWYYRWGEGKPWIKVTNKGTSASYTTVGQNTRDGWQFCCKVIKGDGSELSEIATLHAEY